MNKSLVSAAILGLAEGHLFNNESIIQSYPETIRLIVIAGDVFLHKIAEGLSEELGIIRNKENVVMKEYFHEICFSIGRNRRVL